MVFNFLHYEKVFATKQPFATFLQTQQNRAWVEPLFSMLQKSGFTIVPFAHFFKTGQTAAAWSLFFHGAKKGRHAAAKNRGLQKWTNGTWVVITFSTNLKRERHAAADEMELALQMWKQAHRCSRLAVFKNEQIARQCWLNLTLKNKRHAATKNRGLQK